MMHTVDNTLHVAQNNVKNETPAERRDRLKHERRLEIERDRAERRAKDKAEKEERKAKEKAEREARKAEEKAEKEAKKKERERKKHEDALQAARKKQEKKEELEANRAEQEAYKKKQVTLQQIIIDALNTPGLASTIMLPAAPKIFPQIWKNDLGERHCILVDNDKNTCQDAAMSVVKDEITRYAHKISQCPDKPQVPYTKDWLDFLWSDSQAESCYRRWKHITEPLKKRPAPWGYKSDKFLCYTRHPFDKDPNQPTPLFDEILSRCDDPDTYLKFLAASMNPNAYKQQYLVVRGNGGDGKGVVGRIMYRLLGPLQCSSRMSPPADKFFGTTYEGKSLVVYSELTDPDFVRSDIFMGTTGQDILQVEHKGVDSYNEIPSAMSLVFMNCMPRPLRRRSDLRRILYIEIAPPPEGTELTAEYEAELFLELGGIIAKGEALLERDCARKKPCGKTYYIPIKQPDEIREKIREFAIPVNEDFEDFFEDESDDGPRLKIMRALPGEKTEDLPFMLSSRLREIFRAEFPHLPPKDFEKKFNEFSVHVQMLGAKKGRKHEGRGYYGLIDARQTWTVTGS